MVLIVFDACHASQNQVTTSTKVALYLVNLISQVSHMLGDTQSHGPNNSCKRMPTPQVGFEQKPPCACVSTQDKEPHVVLIKTFAPSPPLPGPHPAGSPLPSPSSPSRFLWFLPFPGAGWVSPGPNKTGRGHQCRALASRQGSAKTRSPGIYSCSMRRTPHLPELVTSLPAELASEDAKGWVTAVTWQKWENFRAQRAGATVVAVSLMGIAGLGLPTRPLEKVCRVPPPSPPMFQP